jgi:hypothetical protein
VESAQAVLVYPMIFCIAYHRRIGEKYGQTRTFLFLLYSAICHQNMFEIEWSKIVVKLRSKYFSKRNVLVSKLIFDIFDLLVSSYE